MLTFGPNHFNPPKTWISIRFSGTRSGSKHVADVLDVVPLAIVGSDESFRKIPNFIIALIVGFDICNFGVAFLDFDTPKMKIQFSVRVVDALLTRAVDESSECGTSDKREFPI